MPVGKTSQMQSRGHMQNQLSVEYPQKWLDVLQLTQKSFEEEAKMAMAAKLFEMKRLSSGMAANLVGIPRVQFLLNLQRFNVAMIDLDEDELYDLKKYENQTLLAQLDEAYVDHPTETEKQVVKSMSKIHKNIIEQESW